MYLRTLVRHNHLTGLLEPERPSLVTGDVKKKSRLILFIYGNQICNLISGSSLIHV